MYYKLEQSVTTTTYYYFEADNDEEAKAMTNNVNQPINNVVQEDEEPDPWVERVLWKPMIDPGAVVDVDCLDEYDYEEVY